LLKGHLQITLLWALIKGLSIIYHLIGGRSKIYRNIQNIKAQCKVNTTLQIFNKCTVCPVRLGEIGFIWIWELRDRNMRLAEATQKWNNEYCDTLTNIYGTISHCYLTQACRAYTVHHSTYIHKCQKFNSFILKNLKKKIRSYPINFPQRSFLLRSFFFIWLNSSIVFKKTYTYTILIHCMKLSNNLIIYK
jgi:hypothetical protein